MMDYLSETRRQPSGMESQDGKYTYCLLDEETDPKEIQAFMND